MGHKAKASINHNAVILGTKQDTYVAHSDFVDSRHCEQALVHNTIDQGPKSGIYP